MSRKASKRLGRIEYKLLAIDSLTTCFAGLLLVAKDCTQKLLVA